MSSVKVSEEEEAVQSVIYPYLRALFVKNRKLQKKEKWIQDVKAVIEILLPDFNYLICDYAIALTEEDLKGILVSCLLAVKGTLYKVLIFESGKVRGKLRLTSTTDVIFGGPIRPEFLGRPPLSHSKLFFWKKSREYSDWMVLFHNQDSFDRQQALLKTLSIIKEKGVYVQKYKD